MIRRAIIYFLVITASLYALRALHYEGLLRSGGYYSKYQAAFKEEGDFDVLFLGSSRVEMHYDTRAFDSLTGRNSFNLGLPGATIHEAYAGLKGYLANHKPPRDLVYEADYHAMMERSTGIMDFNNFFPFLGNKVLRHELWVIDKRMSHFYYNPYYSWPYTGLRNISTSLHGWLGKPVKGWEYYYKGFYKEVLRKPLDYKPTIRKWVYIHSDERAYLDSLIVLCKQNHTRLTLLTSPLFAGGLLDVANKSQVTAQLQDIAVSNQIKYYDLSSLPFCHRRELFIDHYHMNYAGTLLFTPWLYAAFNNKTAMRPLK